MLGLAIDTVEALARGAWVVERELKSLWKAVYEGDDAPRDVVNEAGDILGIALKIRASSSGGPFPLMLIGPHWRLFVSPERGTARIIIDARYLAEYGTESARVEMERVGVWLYGTEGAWRLSRIDVACDVAGVSVAPFADMDAAVTRSATASVYWDDGERDDDVVVDLAARVRAKHRTVQTVTWGGASSRIQACIYDKAAEVLASGKTWQLEAARERGWDGVEPLTRVEFRLRGRGLGEFGGLGLESPRALECVDEWAPMVWAYCTRKYLRYTVPNDDPNRSRWPTVEWWERLQGRAEIAPRARCIGAAAHEEMMRRASRDIMRGAVALCAATASGAAAVEAMCVRVMDGATANAPELELLALAWASHGDLIPARALGSREVFDRAQELRTRMARKRRAVAYAQDAFLAWNKAA